MTDTRDQLELDIEPVVVRDMDGIGAIAASRAELLLASLVPPALPEDVE